MRGVAVAIAGALPSVDNCVYSLNQRAGAIGDAADAT